MFSIIIPVFNTPTSLLKIAINSILKQNYENYEIIIVDDGSESIISNTYDLFVSEYENIFIIHQENNGVSSARNAGVKISQGQYIVFLDSDDYFVEDSLRKFFDYLNNYHIQIF